MKKILVLFKTHLDVGFTNLSQIVVDTYNENYIPRAIRVSKELSQRGCKEGFTWTTGSWLIWQYLDGTLDRFPAAPAETEGTDATTQTQDGT